MQEDERRSRAGTFVGDAEPVNLDGVHASLGGSTGCLRLARATEMDDDGARKRR
jgi:hypothetical protein